MTSERSVAADWGRWIVAQARALPALIRNERETAPERHPAASRLPFVFRTPAGVHVTSDTALKNATVYACVRYLSQTVAQMPWHVFRETPKGVERWQKHPLNYLLNTRPSPEWSSFQFRETLTAWALLKGNGYAEIEVDRAGRPAALWPIYPDRVTPKRDEAGDLYYEVHNGMAPKTELAPDRVFHLRGMGDGPVGIDVIRYAAESIGWAQATEIFGASFYGRGLSPSVVITLNEPLGAEAYDELQRRLEEAHSGPRQSHRPFIIDNAGRATRVSTQPNEAQFIETRQHQVEEICRWFGVPPHKVMHLLRSTFNNIEHQAIEVVVDSVMPWVKRFEMEANFKLFGQNRAGGYSKLNIDGLLRGDAKSRQEALEVMRRNAIINANEWRAMEEMNGIGPDGDKYTMQSQNTTLEMIGAQPPAPVASAPAADDPDDDPEGGEDGGAAMNEAQSTIVAAAARIRQLQNEQRRAA